jgi:hypothetical protein
MYYRKFGNSFLKKLETAVHNQSAPASRGLQLFYLCKEQAESPIWHERANIASNFHGRHGILMVHIWMLNKRLMCLPETSTRAEVQETLFDTLWADTSARIRANGVAEISVNARLKDVQSWSLPTCLELDYAFSLLDPEVKAKAADAKEKPAVGSEAAAVAFDVLPAGSSDSDIVIDHIAGTLWRQLYQRDEVTSDMLETTGSNAAGALRGKTSEEIVTDLASYIYHEYRSLEFDISDRDFSDGMFRFGQIPEQFGICESGEKYDIRSTRTVPNKSDRWAVSGISQPTDNLWKPIMHVDGKIYYWNSETFDSAWEKPK